MRIAIDCDNTWTAAPELFTAFATMAKAQGHLVVCVTGREDNPENRQTVREFVPRDVLVYFTGGALKRWYMEGRGLEIDIWIDDEPTSIGRRNMAVPQ